MVGISTLTLEVATTSIESISTNKNALKAYLADGRTITVPILLFPRLAAGTPAERNNWRLIGRGHGVHWPDLDEDISVECLLSGLPSGESQESLREWLKKRELAAKRKLQSAGSPQNRKLTQRKAS